MNVLRRRWLGFTLGSLAGSLALLPRAANAAAGEATFEVFKDAKGEFRWRLKATNGLVIATSGEGYKAKADCTHGIDLVKELSPKAKVVEA